MIATFPEFSKLTLAHKDEYEELIKDYPPVGDFSFANLMVWWDAFGGLAVSRLSGNLVISYWLPGAEERSGLSLVGTQYVDESICAMFDYLRERNEAPRLVNVPEFVINNMQYPELFNFKVGMGEDEYLLSISKFASLETMPVHMRIRAKKFIREYGERVKVESLGLDSPANRRLLLDSATNWPLKGINSINKLERESLPLGLSYAPVLQTQAICLYLDDELQAFCMYYHTTDEEYALIAYVRVSYGVPRLFDYMVHAFAKYLSEKGFKYINIHSDNGSQHMRALKLALKPEGFFRKYTVEPSTK